MKRKAPPENGGKSATVRQQDFPWHLEVVPLDRIKIDGGLHGYQRERQARDIAEMVAGWDPALYDPIIVGTREDGGMYCIDGQARSAAARALGYLGLPACVLDAETTRQREAWLFLRKNQDRKAVKMYDRYHAALAAKEPWALTCRRIAGTHGLTIGKRVSPGVIGSVQALRQVFNLGSELLLHRTLGFIVAAWGTNNETAMSAPLVRGISLLLCDLDAEEDRRATRKLRRTAPDAILAAANRAQATRRAHAYAAAAYVAQALANRCDIPWTLKRSRRRPVLSNGAGEAPQLPLAAKDDS